MLKCFWRLSEPRNLRGRLDGVKEAEVRLPQGEVLLTLVSLIPIPSLISLPRFAREGTLLTAFPVSVFPLLGLPKEK